MPKVIVKATPGPDVPGRWALGIGMRQKFDANGKTVTDANGNPQYWPARSGMFFPSGQDVEITITDEELKDLQSGANAQLFAVVVTDESAQPSINEGGSSMATQPQPAGSPPPPNQPGTTVPPGTTPQPTPTPPTPQGPQPTGEPAPKKASR
jgi:hypothetical protein